MTSNKERDLLRRVYLKKRKLISKVTSPTYFFQLNLDSDPHVGFSVRTSGALSVFLLTSFLSSHSYSQMKLSGPTLPFTIDVVTTMLRSVGSR